MPLTIAIPHERRPDERRVALVPQLAGRLVQLGARLRVEAGAARSSGFHDSAWELPGVEVVADFASAVTAADVVIKVAPPTLEEVRRLPRGCTLVSLVSAFQHLDVVEALRARDITTLAMDLVPRRTRARSMNAVASQGTVAGYKAALLAAELSPRLFPMLTTAAGTVRPSQVVVIGAGIAGLQAIATVRRLGARVEAYDIRRAARERIESLGATMIETGVVAEGADGLARPLRRDELERQHDALGERLARAHAVICAASIPGRHAPLIVSRDLVERMLPDTVIVDLAASTGGNCELTQPGKQVVHNDVLVVGPLNLPSHGAVHASEMYAHNVVNFLELILVDGALQLDPGDEIVSRMVLTHAGAVHHLPTAGLLGVPSVPYGEHGGARAAPSGPPGDVDDGSDDWLSERDELSASAVPESPPEAVAPDAPDAQPALDEAEALAMDDFTAIDGIGPALQGRLRDFGFRRYADLATLDADRLERLTLQLELDDEIERGDWVGQAQRLMRTDAGRAS